MSRKFSSLGGNAVKIIKIAVIVIAMILFYTWQNNAISKTEIDYVNAKVPKEFYGFKVVHLSDLHNKWFGKNQAYLLEKIREISPDIIVFTGDLIDRRRYDLDPAMVFIEGALEIAPVYYVSGNHEAWSGDYDNLRSKLSQAGVQILDNEKVTLARGVGEIAILGLSDPGFVTSYYYTDNAIAIIGEELSRLSDPSRFQLLLSHRPELFDLYSDVGIDIIFSGHAHGGQIRLPFIGALVAPNQGLFPKLTEGAYTQKESTLIVSRGLGNSVIPIRLFNRPEIVVVTFRTPEE